MWTLIDCFVCSLLNVQKLFWNLSDGVTDTKAKLLFG